MNTSHRTTIHHEIHRLLEAHLDAISRYGVEYTIVCSDKLDELIDEMTRLWHMTHMNPEELPPSEVQKAMQSFHTVANFMNTINANRILNNSVDDFSHMYRQICRWFDEAMQDTVLSIEKVWCLIDPAQPDTLTCLGHNQYEAYWWTPIPQMDIEILRRTPGVTIIGEPYTPEQMSAGTALRFSIVEVNAS